MEPEVEQTLDQQMIKYKGRDIMQQHFKDKLIKGGLRIWYRAAPKTGYLYEFDICTGRKETTEFGLGDSVVLQLTEKLKGSFCCIFFDNFFTLPLTGNSLYGIGVARQNRKLLPKIEKPTIKKSQAEKNRRGSKSQKISFISHCLLVKNLSIVEIATT